MSLIDEKSIKNQCTIPVTFGRGKGMYEEDSVFSLLMKKYSENTVQMIGVVEGSHGDSMYHTQVKLERIPGKTSLAIGEGSCDCKAFVQYSGFCKHLVATLLETNFCVNIEEVNDLIEHGSVGEIRDVTEENYEEGDRYLNPLLESGLLQKGSTFSGGPKWSEPESSQELLEAISGMVLKERNRFCREMETGDVQLEVTLHLDVDEEYMELRIGRKQMYVVKNIYELLDHIRNQDLVRYGQKLEFVHSQSAFTRESLQLISLMLTAPDVRRGEYLRWYQSADDRYLTLDSRMLEELLQMYEGSQILVSSCLHFDKMLTPVKKENPKLPIIISGMPGGRESEVIFPEILVLEGIHSFAIWWEHCIYLCDEEYCEEMRELCKLMAVNYLQKERRQGGRYTHRFLKENIPLTLCEKDYAAFCTTALPVLRKWADVRVEDIDLSKYQIEEGKYELYLDLTKEKDVICEAKAIYGEKEHNLLQMAKLTETYRDVRTEYELRSLVESYFPETSKDRKHYLLRQDDDRLAELVEHGIEHLKNYAQVYVSEAFKQIRISTTVNISTGLSIKGNLLNVSWDIHGMSKEELSEVLSAYRRKKKYYRLRNGELLNLAASGIDTFAQMEEDLHLTKSQLKEGMAEVPLYRALYLNALMKENADHIRVTRDEMFERWMHQADTIRGKKYTVPEEVQGNLREYQKEGYRWACALSELGFGGILADDMGLGKTLQMISYLCTRKGMVHLVVCPASLVYNWEAEFEHFAPSMRVATIVGTAAERRQILEDWQYYDVLITSYDLLKRDIDLFIGKSFGCQIIDEAQYIKNPMTQAAKAVKAIESRNRFALTGTPIENRLSELWSIFEYLMPGYLFRYKYFKENFEQDILEKTERAGEATERLHKMIAPFLLRRLKKDVLKDLPDKVEKVIYTRFGKEQEQLYKAAEKNIVINLKKNGGGDKPDNKIQILAELTKLREICCDPALLYENYRSDSAKMTTCMEVIENAIEGGHRILLFSQFTTMLDRIAAELERREITYFMLTGATSKPKRRELVERFQRGEAEIFLISLKAGGTGLNLTAADMVIHYDPWWNVAAQNQATDRTHRIGQENRVTVFKLIAKDTIEERILKLQENKKDLADKVLSAEGVSLSTLTSEEIRELLLGNQ